MLGNAENYISWSMWTPDMEFPVELTIRRYIGGLTPAEKVARLEKRVAELELANRTPEQTLGD